LRTNHIRIMSLVEVINADMKTAMKAKDRDKLTAIRAIKAALMLEATKDGSGDISADTELAILKKLYKQRVDASVIYTEQDRPDLAEVETFQAGVIKVYLPEQMSEEAVKEIVLQVISKVGATGPGDMGKVMGAAMGQLNGKADGGVISKAVKESLASL
jgi:uncharacterized protein YqeY